MSALPAEAGDGAYGEAGAAVPPASSVPAASRVSPAAPGARPGAARLRRPGLHVVPAMRRSRAPLAPFVAVVTACLVLGLAVLLGLNTLLAQDAFRLHDLEQANARLGEREQALERELTVLESPATLAERAEGLGMLPSSAPLFLRLPDGAVLGTAPQGDGGSADPDALAAVQAAKEESGDAAATGGATRGQGDPDASEAPSQAASDEPSDETSGESGGEEQAAASRASSSGQGSEASSSGQGSRSSAGSDDGSDDSDDSDAGASGSASGSAGQDEEDTP